MCGRAKLPEDLSELKQDLHIKWDRLGAYEPRYNVAPTTMMPIVTSDGGERTIEWMRWGLIPSWAKDEKIGYSTFNARADSVATKPAFRGAWRAGRRCLVVTGGFYESGANRISSPSASPSATTSRCSLRGSGRNGARLAGTNSGPSPSSRQRRTR